MLFPSYMFLLLSQEESKHVLSLFNVFLSTLVCCNLSFIEYETFYTRNTKLFDKNHFFKLLTIIRKLVEIINHQEKGVPLCVCVCFSVCFILYCIHPLPLQSWPSNRGKFKGKNEKFHHGSCSVAW